VKDKDFLIWLKGGHMNTGRLQNRAVKIILAGVMAGSMAVAFAATKTNIEFRRPVEIRLTGIVSDSFCGADHGIKAIGDPECTRSCVALGAQFALVSGRRVYILQGAGPALDRLAGTRVMIKGVAVSRDTIVVEGVEGTMQATK
jgi:hypothetical protein